MVFLYWIVLWEFIIQVASRKCVWEFGTKESLNLVETVVGWRFGWQIDQVHKNISILTIMAFNGTPGHVFSHVEDAGIIL
jgi:hypothetical protein